MTVFLMVIGESMVDTKPAFMLIVFNFHNSSLFFLCSFYVKPPTSEKLPLIGINHELILFFVVSPEIKVMMKILDVFLIS